MKRPTMIFAVVSTLLMLPAMFYMYQFSFHIWNRPQFYLSDNTNEWANLGSYIGGIYAPILSLITLFLISVQIFIQNQQHIQSLIIHQEEQLKEYVLALEEELNQPFPGHTTVRDLLVELLQNLKANEIEEFPAAIVLKFNETNHRVFSMWCEVIKCLIVLDEIAKKSPPRNIYNKIAFESNKNKVVAYLNPQSCRMLDRFHYVFSMKCLENGIAVPVNSMKYFYSDIRADN